MNDLIHALALVAQLEEFGNCERLALIAEYAAIAAENPARTPPERRDFQEVAKAALRASKRARKSRRASAVAAARQLSR